MELQIRITGMCLIVPQVVDGNQRYHILLPASSHHPTHRHSAVLTYHGGSAGGYNLGCHLLDLSGIEARRESVNLVNVVDVGVLMNDKVEAKQVGIQPGREVYARVTLPMPTSTIPGDLATWQPHKRDETPMPAVESTHHMTWVYEDFNFNSLNLTLARLENGCADNPTTPALADPISQDGVYCINILHLPPLGTVVPVNTFAPHFPMYSDLFPPQDPPVRKPQMKLRAEPSGPASEFMCRNAPEPFLPIESETAYNCMLAQSGIK